MKKAKIMLTIIGVLAIISGALAFKVSKFGTDQIYTPGLNGICNVVAHGITVTAIGTKLVSASPVALTTTCGLTFTTKKL